MPIDYSKDDEAWHADKTVRQGGLKNSDIQQVTDV